MRYVNAIKRMVALDAAMLRMEARDLWDEQRDDLYERLYNKRKALGRVVKAYLICPNRADVQMRHTYRDHRRQFRTACRILGVNYFDVQS